MNHFAEKFKFFQIFVYCVGILSQDVIVANFLAWIAIVIYSQDDDKLTVEQISFQKFCSGNF